MSATRLVTVDDVPILTELLVANREFFAPWQSIWGDDYYTGEGQDRLIRKALERHAQGTALPHVILDDGGRVVGRLATCARTQRVRSLWHGAGIPQHRR